MGRVHKLLLRSCLKGVLVGWAILGLGLALNIMNMRELIFSSSDKILATSLLMVGFAITFGNAFMGRAVMTLHRREHPKD